MLLLLLFSFSIFSLFSSDETALFSDSTDQFYEIVEFKKALLSIRKELKNPYLTKAEVIILNHNIPVLEDKIKQIETPK